MIPSQENLVETNLKNYLVVYSIVYSRPIFDLFLSFNEKHRCILKKKIKNKALCWHFFQATSTVSCVIKTIVLVAWRWLCFLFRGCFTKSTKCCMLDMRTCLYWTHTNAFPLQKFHWYNPLQQGCPLVLKAFWYWLSLFRPHSDKA